MANLILSKGQNIHEEGYYRSIHRIYRPVNNHRDQPNCLAHALTQMLTFYFRMAYGPHLQDLELVITPIQRVKSIEQAENVLCNPDRGLQDVTIDGQSWVKTRYVYGDGPHFWINSLITNSGMGILCHLLQNFGPEGPCYPMVGFCNMDDMSNTWTARRSSKKSPYNRPPDGNRQLRKPNPNHALLIVGLYTNSSEPLRLSLKCRNSWGRDWGIGGHFWLDPRCLGSVARFGDPVTDFVLEDENEVGDSNGDGHGDGWEGVDD